MSQRLRVVMLCSEVVPYAKTGGLADVAGALPRALASRGHEVHVVMPLYSRVDRDRHGVMPLGDSVEAPMGGWNETVGLHTARRREGEPHVWMLAHSHFDRPELYGEHGGDYGDNHRRFGVFCRAALELVRQRFPRPDVLHLHDWQTGLAAVDLRADAGRYSTDPAFEDTRVVFTIHNLAYAGAAPAEALGELGLSPNLYHPEALEFYGRLALIKGGLVFADALTTVSPRYALEIQTPELGFGLDGLLRARARSLVGILNGIDVDEWNPATDPHLPAHYSIEDLSGKAACKTALQKEMGLEVRADAPLFGVVARLAWQKGIDLVADVADKLCEAGAQLAILGRGEADLERQLVDISGRRPGKLAVRVDFDEGLAHRIEAGSDAFLMPSRYEPCGLNQLYSLRYGTVPVVRAVGGLDDTVEELDAARDSGTGFKFGSATPEALWGTLERVLDTFHRREVWHALVRRGMAKDFSWDASAAAYERLYETLRFPGRAGARESSGVPAW